MVGFTGTQYGLLNPQRETLYFVLKTLREQGEVYLHHGCCIEADEDANDFWRALGGQTVGHPPTDQKKMSTCEVDVMLEPRPYLHRNHDIVAANKRLIACPKGLTEEVRSGTWATIRFARKTRKQICIIQPNGNIKEELFA